MSHFIFWFVAGSLLLAAVPNQMAVDRSPRRACISIGRSRVGFAGAAGLRPMALPVRGLDRHGDRAAGVGGCSASQTPCVYRRVALTRTVRITEVSGMSSSGMCSST